MTVLQVAAHERLVKSDDRVRDLGEVFTPAGTVAAMLDLLPAEIWKPHPSSTFLEPACGDGNFLVAILDRKLESAETAARTGQLAAGGDEAARAFHGLEALSSIYAVDISADNVVGGTPGHEIGARDRLLAIFKDWWAANTESRLTARSPLLRSARWVVDRNILVGNMLAENADGSPSGREDLPLVEYTWDPVRGTVAVICTTFGAVMAEQVAATTGVMSLFDVTDENPQKVWEGLATDLHRAPVPAPTAPRLVARNGNGRF